MIDRDIEGERDQRERDKDRQSNPVNDELEEC